jgi:hypothetical protein
MMRSFERTGKSKKYWKFSGNSLNSHWEKGDIVAREVDHVIAHKCDALPFFTLDIKCFLVYKSKSLALPRRR